jgi:AraC-like DNA-binding protein
MPDRLSALLLRFDLRARVFHGGALCTAASFDGRLGVGHLHLLRRGALRLTLGRRKARVFDRPGVLFLARPTAHRLEADGPEGAEVVCATIEFGVGDENPVLRALPALLHVPLAAMPALEQTQQLLFGEAFGARCGHGAAVDRLAEVFVIQLLRHAIEQRLVDAGLLAGLADPRLNKALNAMHAEPARAWTLEAMAAVAGMSRARFAAHFARHVGTPPGEYLTTWRLGLARSLLRKGLSVKQVAAEVGYANGSALGRVFTHKLGASPTAWQVRTAAAAR